jgi:predicted dehydrogenase
LKKFNVGLLGCGDVSDIYFETCKTLEILQITACASLHLENARKKALKHGIPKACSIEQLIGDSELDIILNLTVPEAHEELTLAALEAGKHVYSEKPLAADLAGGRRILSAARSKGLQVGCAPDTFLGGRLQTCRRVLDEGLIGDPLGAAAFMVCHGHEWHHPNPAFFYQKGGGPLLDMGPYYLTALVSLLGPAVRCCGLAKRGFSERAVESGARRGETLRVEVPTHVCGSVEFEVGALATIVTSFDVWDSQLPRIEIYGTKGTLCLPDPDPLDGPNLFGGPVWVKTKEKSRWCGLPRAGGLDEWEEVPAQHHYNRNSRGLGLVDLAYAIRNGRPARAGAQMAYHCLEIAHGLLRSSEQTRYYRLRSSCTRPASLPIDFPDGEAQAGPAVG